MEGFSDLGGVDPEPDQTLMKKPDPDPILDKQAGIVSGSDLNSQQ